MRLFSIFVVFLFVVGCNSGDSSLQKNIDLKNITDLEEEILTLANASVCNSETECASIGFGSKACGGHLSYLVYSSSIDIDLLVTKVKQFNQIQKEYNIKYGIIFDCSIVNPPKRLICENNKCKAIYD